MVLWNSMIPSMIRKNTTKNTAMCTIISTGTGFYQRYQQSGVRMQQQQPLVSCPDASLSSRFLMHDHEFLSEKSEVSEVSEVCWTKTGGGPGVNLFLASVVDQKVMLYFVGRDLFAPNPRHWERSRWPRCQRVKTWNGHPMRIPTGWPSPTATSWKDKLLNC